MSPVIPRILTLAIATTCLGASMPARTQASARERESLREARQVALPQPSAKQSAARKPAAQRAAEKSRVPEPAVPQLPVEQPRAQKEALRQPAPHEPTTQQPPTRTPAAQKPAVQKPAAAQEPATQKPAVNAQAAAISAFVARLEAYLVLRNKAESGLSPQQETNDPAAILVRERALARAIRAARPGAQAGDLFGRDMTPLLVQVIRRDWKGRAPRDRAALFSEMPKPFVPRVNADYPAGWPLMTFPATLLRELQPLPDDLEYRFVGRHLILRDSKANLIVDVIRDVLVG